MLRNIHYIIHSKSEKHTVFLTNILRQANIKGISLRTCQQVIRSGLRFTGLIRHHRLHMISIHTPIPVCIYSRSFQSQGYGKIPVGIQLYGVRQLWFISIAPITRSRIPASHRICQWHILHHHAIEGLDISFQHNLVTQPISFRNRSEGNLERRSLVLPAACLNGMFSIRTKEPKSLVRPFLVASSLRLASNKTSS